MVDSYKVILPNHIVEPLKMLKDIEYGRAVRIQGKWFLLLRKPYPEKDQYISLLDLETKLPNIIEKHEDVTVEEIKRVEIKVI